MTNRVIPIRASSFGALFDCSHMFEGQQLLGMHKASSLRAHLGTSIHASTAAFDQAKLSGAPISAADAAEVLVETFWNPAEEVNVKDDKLSMRDAEKIALTLHTKYCSSVAPLLQYQSVEMQLLPLVIDCGDDLSIELRGTMDRARVVQAGEGKVIADLKTGARLISDGKVSTKGRAAQLGTYQLLSENTDGEQTIGSQIIALQTTSACETGISHVFDAKRMMLGYEGVPGLLDYAAAMFKSGSFPPNPQSVLCDKKYCARHSVCRYRDA